MLVATTTAISSLLLLLRVICALHCVCTYCRGCSSALSDNEAREQFQFQSFDHEVERSTAARYFKLP
jgi:hypothetical protein